MTLSGCIPTSNKSSGLLSTPSSQSQSQTNTTVGTGTYQVIPAGAAFNLTGTLTASMNLGTKSDQTYTLHTGAYSGSITLTVEHDEVSAVDAKSQVSFIVTPSVIATAPNSNYTFTVSTVTTQAAPDFALHYHVFARDSAGSIRKESGMQTDFAVNPIFDITIGAGNALNTVIWSTDLVSPTTGIGTKQPVAFIAHTGGVTVRFINMDPNGPHIIHGSGLIPHQNTTTFLRSLATGAVNPVGRTYIDSYDVKVTSTTAGGSGAYYLHDAESGAKSGTITFNVNAASVKPTVVDATATFTKVNTNILQSKCVSCHNAGNASGGVDLSTYAKVALTTVPYDFASSSLYTSVLANMPLGGTALSTTDKDLIKNWIINGAPNN